MTQVAGVLEIQMQLGLARIADDIQKAKQEVNRGMESIKGAAESARGALEALGIGLGVYELKEFISSTIEAADHLEHLTKSTGLTVETLAGLKMLAAETGTDMEGLAKGLNKMSVEMGKSPEKFKELGITAKDEAGALAQVSDVFMSLTDVYQRNALSQAIFKKGWVELAPALSLGGDKIREVIEQGAKLSGITEENAKQAHEFHVKTVELSATMEGFKTKSVLTLLPLMEMLVADFKDLATKSHDASNGFNPLLETFKAIMVFGGNVSFVLKGIGRDIGGAMAMSAAAAQGNFAGARAALDALRKDDAAARKEFDEWEKKILAVGTLNKQQAAANESATGGSGTAGASSAQQAAAARRAQNFLDADKRGAAEAKKQQEEYQKITGEVLKFNAAQKLELEQGEKLTAGQTLALNILDKIRDSTIKLTPEQKIELAGKLELALATEQLNIKELEHEKRAHEVAQKVIKDYEDQQKALTAYEDEWNKYLGGLEASIKTLTDENDMFALTASQIAQVNLQRAEETLETAKANGVQQDYIDRLQREVDLRKQILDKTTVLEGKQAWMDMWKSIDTAAHDAWMHIGDQGNNVFKSLILSISNIGKELAYLTLKKWVINIVAPGLGMSDAANGGGFGGLGGLFGNLFGGGNASSGIDFSAGSGAAGINLGASSSGAGIDLSGFGSSFLGSFATGLDNVPRDGLAMVHEGEKITPKAQNNGNGITLNYNFAPVIDSRTDRAAVYSDMQKIAENSANKMVDDLKRQRKIS